MKRSTPILKPTPSVALPTAQLEQLITSTLDDNKAEDILAIDLKGKADFADKMVIASGTSARHVAALAEHIVHSLKGAGYTHVPTEGKETGDWVLVDAGDIIVHLFKPEMREHYNLEKMWAASFPATAPKAV